MPGKFRFVLGLHCHQPVGNFDYVFEHGYVVSYLPFIETLSRFPAVRAVLHYSGPLLEWISEKHPEFFRLISELVARGQVEITGGGHYEPILPVMPRRDSLGQLRYMNRYLDKLFGVKVRGAWLTERIWEPALPSVLAEAGLEFVTVDDFHFLAAGFDIESLHGYYLSEDQGRTVGIFPISRNLRYMVPFYEVEEVLAFFRRKAETLPAGAVLTLADDGEKFGMWPGTHDWVYKRGWLEKFFTALTDSAGWLETTTFSAVLDSTAPTGKVYLPCSSYFEMGGWSLPSQAGERFQKLQSRLEREGEIEEFAPFLRGSFWRNFLVKYPESDWMHKRMWLTSRLVHETVGDRPYSGARVPESLRRLWMAQCNCAYWHGIFGGLYLPHLRRAIYSCLISAEKLARPAKSAAGIDCLEEDIDRDGHAEVVLRSERFNLFVKPSAGGAIVELDDLASEFNLTDTLARRREAYHWQMVEGGEQEEGGGGHATIHDRHFETKVPASQLVYDRLPRHMLQDHLFAALPESAEAASRGEPADIGDFAAGAWDWRLRRGVTGAVSLVMERRGALKPPAGEPRPVELVKKITLRPGSGDIEIEYGMTNPGAELLEAVFAVAFNLTVLGPADPQVGLRTSEGRTLGLSGAFVLENQKQVTVYNRRDRVDFGLAFSPRPERLIQYPVETVSQSEKGVDRTYQATCLLPAWPVKIGPASSQKVRIVLTLSN